jgi:hypothetical protein
MNRSLVLLVSLSAGCIPLRPTVREARSGVVLNAQTRTPVVGAIVRVESYRVSVPPGYGGRVTLLDRTEIKTDSSGRWSVTSAHEWTIGILAADGFPLYSEVYCVSGAGYLDEVRTPNASYFLRERSGADDNTGRTIDPVLLLVPKAPHSSQEEHSPAAETSCIQRLAAQRGIAADRAAPGR